MEFLNPGWLWGITAVALPVIIHFWYQKKGREIAWAASEWLVDKTSLQHRGIKLDEIFLLIIRCLLIILLAFLLSKPISNWFANDARKQVIYLVEPDSRVVSNFRFEIENALKKKEKIMWMGEDLKSLTDISAIPEKSGGLYAMQQNINVLANEGAHLHLYFRNDQIISRLSKIYIPGTYELNAVTDSVTKPVKTFNYLAQQLGKQQLNVLIDYQNPDEARTVRAGLAALEDVFKIPLRMDLKMLATMHYDWILTDKPMSKPDRQTLYVVPGNNVRNTLFTNVIEVRDSMLLATSEMVQSGQLPEWLGEILIAHYQLDKRENPLSDRQLRAHFVRVKSAQEQATKGLQQWLLLLFVGTLLLERWISLKQSTGRRYA